MNTNFNESETNPQKKLAQEEINNMSLEGLVIHWVTGDSGGIYYWLNPEALGPKASDLNTTIEWSRSVG